jgi:protein-tyrosine kinase
MNKPVDFASDLLAPKSSDSKGNLLIGQVLRTFRQLSAEQVEKVLVLQRSSGMRFGEAAIKLKLVSNADVVYALSQQYSYPYSLAAKGKVNAELVTATAPFSKQSEVFRAIRHQLLARDFSDQVQRRPLAIISPNMGDGRSFFAANLAVSFSQLGSKVLLIDADLRTPRQHSIFGLTNTEGLSGVLSGRATDAAPILVPDLPSLSVMPAGPVPPNPLELIERTYFSDLVRSYSERFEYVIVDTPAASYGADALALAHKCGLALCLAREGKTKRNALIDLMESLSSGTVRHVGAILNRF